MRLSEGQTEPLSGSYNRTPGPCSIVTYLQDRSAHGSPVHEPSKGDIDCPDELEGGVRS